MGGAFGQPGPESGAQVCRLPAQERTQVTSGTKQWGLRDCRSLAASWPAWVLGFPPTGRGLQLLSASLSCPGPVSGLGAPQGNKGVPQLQAV